MKKVKKSAYTLILIATCLIASPFMIHKILKSDNGSEKNPETSAMAENSQPDTPESVPETPENDSAENPGNPDVSADSMTDMALFTTSDVSYFDDALFIGDSRTVGIKEYGIFKKSDFFCSVGMSASQINDEKIDGLYFDEKIDSKQYGKVYIMLGINEVGNDIEYTLTAYRAIVEKIKVHQPEALIYLQGNLHVAASAETEYINNTAINNLNSRIASLADNKRVFYVDINEVYDDDYGYFMESYTSDGIHPLAMYYTQWCDWLCTKTIVKDEAPV